MRLRDLASCVSLALVACSPSASPPAPAPPQRATGSPEVTLGPRATEPFSVRDRASGVTARVSLLGARDVAAVARGNVTVYEHALGEGLHVEHRARTDGTEDFVHFPSRPPVEELRYRVDTRGVAGLRMVAGTGTLELLDAGGVPRVRMAPPYGVSAHGARFAVDVRVEGCAVDTSSAPPWGRAITPPAAEACELVIAWGGARAVYPAAVDPAWTVTGAMAVARGRHSATLLGDGRVLVAGGYPPTASAEIFDPASGTWATVGSMAGPRVDHPAALRTDGKAIVVGGGDDTTGLSLSTTEVYDPVSGTFSSGPTMGQARRRHALARIGDGTLVVTGGAGVGDFQTWETLAPGGSIWTTAGMIAAREAHASVALADGRVLVAGGYDPVGPTYKTVVELLDPKTGVSLVSPAIVTPRVWFGAAPLPDGTVLLAGGLVDPGMPPTASVERFDPAANAGAGAVVAAPPLSVARTRFGLAVRADGSVIIAGGGGGSLGTDALLGVEVFAPQTGAWSQVGTLVSARTSATVTALADGGILAAGGNDGDTALASVERCSDGLCAKVPCTTKSDCEPGQHCAGGTCVSTSSNGHTCTAAADCLSGFCAHGVCCNSACDSDCVSCNVSDKQSSPSGTCGAVAAGLDPFDKCPASGTICGPKGVCNGLGTCALPTVAGTSCGVATTCNAGTLYTPRCDGAGACVPVAASTCYAKTCAGNGCGPNTCAGDADCDAGLVCANGACSSPPGGKCSVLLPCVVGTCSIKDAICCNTACDGACESCVSPDPGTCTPRPAVPVVCTVGIDCCGIAACDGASSTPQYPGASSPCGTGLVCDQGKALTGTHDACDGAGKCVAGPEVKQDCFPYTCFYNATECLGYCGANGATCAAGAHCVDSKCVIDSDAGAAGAGGAGVGGAGGSTGAGGGSGSAGETDAGVDGGSEAPDGGGIPASFAPADGGCGCRAAGEGDREGGWLTLGLAGLAMIARRARRLGGQGPGTLSPRPQSR